MFTSLGHIRRVRRHENTAAGCLVLIYSLSLISVLNNNGKQDLFSICLMCQQWTWLVHKHQVNQEKEYVWHWKIKWIFYSGLAQLVWRTLRSATQDPGGGKYGYFTLETESSHTLQARSWEPWFWCHWRLGQLTLRAGEIEEPTAITLKALTNIYKQSRLWTVTLGGQIASKWRKVAFFSQNVLGLNRIPIPVLCLLHM